MFFRLTRLIAPAILMAATSLPAGAASCPPLLDHQLTSLQDGKPFPLCQYAGKVILVVNTASYCGFTSQYDGLEKLYARLKDKGLVVLGFPSNDFGEQEPGTEKEIAEFCRLTYGVEFPMAGKTVVKGKNAHPFYLKLAEITGSRPKWNFHKYVINRDATQIVAYGSQTRPDDKDLLQTIDRFLAQ